MCSTNPEKTLFGVGAGVEKSGLFRQETYPNMVMGWIGEVGSGRKWWEVVGSGGKTSSLDITMPM